MPPKKARRIVRTSPVSSKGVTKKQEEDTGTDEEDPKEKKAAKRQRAARRRVPHKPKYVGPRANAFGNFKTIGSDIICVIFRCLDWPSHVALTHVCRGLQELATCDAARPTLIHIPSTKSTRAFTGGAYARTLAKLMPAKRLVSQLQLLTVAARHLLRNADLQRNLHHLSISVAPACNIGADAFIGFVSLRSLCVVATNWVARGWRAAFENLPPSVTSLELRSISSPSPCADKGWRTLPSTVTTLRIGVYTSYDCDGLCGCEHSRTHTTIAAAASEDERRQRQRETPDVAKRLPTQRGAIDEAADIGLWRYELGHRAGRIEWRRLLRGHPRLRALRLGNLDLTLKWASDWWTARLRRQEAEVEDRNLNTGADDDEKNEAINPNGGDDDDDVHGRNRDEVKRDEDRERKVQKISSVDTVDSAAIMQIGAVIVAPYVTLRILVAPLHSVFTFWMLLLSLHNLHTALFRRSRLVRPRLDASDDDVYDDVEKRQRHKHKSRKLHPPPDAIHHAQLRTLDLSFSILDADLTVLSACRLPALRVLDLSCTPIAPDALHVLERFSQLRILSLHQTLCETLAGHVDNEEEDDVDHNDDDVIRDAYNEKREAEMSGHFEVEKKTRGGGRGDKNRDEEGQESEWRLPALLHLRYLDIYHAECGGGMTRDGGGSMTRECGGSMTRECGGSMTRDGERLATLYPSLEYLRPSDTRFEVLQKLTTLTSLDMTRDRTEPLPSLCDLVDHLPRLHTLVLPTRLKTRRVIPLYGRPHARVRDTAAQMRLEAGLESALTLTVLVAKSKNDTAKECRERLQKDARTVETCVFQSEDCTDIAHYPWSALERRARDTGVCL
jgi:hypothetical protein